jgi:hypothetical protein
MAAVETTPARVRGRRELLHGAGPGPAPMPPGQVLELQRAAGNHTVARLLAPHVVQRAVKARVMGASKSQAHTSLTALCAQFGITREDLVPGFKTKLFAGPLFPAVYKQNYDANKWLQKEVRDIVLGLDDLVAAAVSRSEIVAGKGDGGAVAAQLFGIIGNAITAARLNAHMHYYLITTLGVQDVGIYVGSLNAVVQRLDQYKAQIDPNAYDPATLAKNEQMDNRRAQLRGRSRQLQTDLDTAVRGGQVQATAAAIQQIRTLVADIDEFEKAWDLDFWVDREGIEEKLAGVARGTELEAFYAPGGGEDDEMAVKDVFKPLLACSLYALLALKGRWLDTNDPRTLHAILRKTGKLKDYDDNQAAAQVRLLAGLNATVVGNQTLGQYILAKKAKGEKESFIADIEGEAHTFAAVWKDNDYKKVDETGSNGSLAKYARNRVLAVWRV